MKIITFAAIKGGVGKTTLAFNYAEWLAANNNNVLLLDLDHQCNLSQIYNCYDTEGTVGNIFLGNGLVKIHSIKKNISLIVGDMHLDDIETSIENKTNKNMLLYMWLSDNYEKLHIDKYDYIIIDTHPDFATATKNAVIISNTILSPITPSEHGYNAKFNLEERINELSKEAIDFSTRQSYVTAKLFFLANMVRHNTKSSHELLEVIKDDDRVLAKIPEKELFNRSTLDKMSLSTMSDDHKMYVKQSKFFDEINQIFTDITKII